MHSTFTTATFVEYVRKWFKPMGPAQCIFNSCFKIKEYRNGVHSAKYYITVPI